MKISIITVCKNSEQTIEKCIRSVIGQSYHDIEYVVIDGQSTDKTGQVLKNYQHAIDTLISEKDNGIYNAMNKGIVNSTGKVLFFLNSDDYFFDNEVVADVMAEFQKNASVSILYGNVVVIDQAMERIVRYNNISKRFFYKNTICHQATFSKKETYTLLGYFDERYKIHADTDWLMKAYFNTAMRPGFKYLDRIIACFSEGGFCSAPDNIEKYKYHRQEISAKFFWEAKYKLIIKKVLKAFGVRI